VTLDQLELSLNNAKKEYADLEGAVAQLTAAKEKLAEAQKEVDAKSDSLRKEKGELVELLRALKTEIDELIASVELL